MSCMRNLIVDGFFFFFFCFLLCCCYVDTFTLIFWVNEMVRHVANGYVWCVVAAFHNNNNNSLLLSWTVCVCVARHGIFLGVYSLCRVFFSFPLNRFAQHAWNDPKKIVRKRRNSLHFSMRENLFQTLNETIQKCMRYEQQTPPQRKGEWSGKKQCNRRRWCFFSSSSSFTTWTSKLRH